MKDEFGHGFQAAAVCLVIVLL
ncbi:MAG: hypothetical protein JWR55_207, partial [Aeromicrobium sp.]|nr:hypothetical protein [Aeromicrobium sp.]